jgi:hypothetical protein
VERGTLEGFPIGLTWEKFPDTCWLPTKLKFSTVIGFTTKQMEKFLKANISVQGQLSQGPLIVEVWCKALPGIVEA